jgi:hypothetical protein
MHEYLKVNDYQPIHPCEEKGRKKGEKKGLKKERTKERKEERKEEGRERENTTYQQKPKR